jgi:hypothetical protein
MPASAISGHFAQHVNLGFETGFGSSRPVYVGAQLNPHAMPAF